MKVLVIEDDHKTLDDITQAFQLCLPEAELICTNLGIEGIKLSRSLPADLMILDMSIQDVSGFDVLREIRQRSKVPVIIMSMSKDESDIVKCLELGADEYIVKPFRQLEFMAHVRALLKREDSLSNLKHDNAIRRKEETKKKQGAKATRLIIIRSLIWEKKRKKKRLEQYPEESFLKMLA
jgi:DNA-binding response OmpR family regulator